MLPVDIYGLGPLDLVRLCSSFHTPLSFTFPLFDLMLPRGIMADGRYEIEIGTGIFNRWID
jgi:hypothetical protein